MKLTSKDLKSLIVQCINEKKDSQTVSEDYLRGIPDFVLREEASKCASNMKKHIAQFVLMNKSKSHDEQRVSMQAAQEIVDDFEKEVFELMQNKLWQYLRQI